MNLIERFLDDFDEAVDDVKTKLIFGAIKAHPDAVFALLRRVRPILETPVGYLITRFDDVQEALERNTIFTVKPYAPKMDPSVGPFMLARDGTTINSRDKGIMRAMLSRDDLPKVRTMAADLAKKAVDAAGGRIEVVSQLSRLVPVQMTGDYFGFPGPSEAKLFEWSRATQYDMFHNPLNDPEVHRANVAAGQEMSAYLQQDLIPKRRAELQQDPNKDDILSRLLRMSLPEEIGFDDARVRTNTMGLLVGGVETTSQAVVQILDQFLRCFPKEMAAARTAAGDNETFDRYTWEALRFNPINPFVIRLCVEDYIIARGTDRETEVPAGSVTFISARSAMMDGKQMTDPDDFRTDRPPYRYMHFGYGAHTCLGDHVSTVVIPELVKALLVRDGLRPAEGDDGEIDFEDGPFPERYVLCYDA